MTRTRVTFRIETELAQRLRRLPNQTRLVEAALRDALVPACPLCRGSGRTLGARLRVSDFRAASLPRLDRDAANHLKRLVRFGRRMLATDLDLAAHSPGGDLDFRLARDEQTLLSGRLGRADGAIRLS